MVRGFAVKNHAPQIESFLAEKQTPDYDCFARLAQILGDPKKGIPPIIPVSRATWYRGIKEGKFPKPHYLGSMTAVWLLSDIQKLISDTVEQSNTK